MNKIVDPTDKKQLELYIHIPFCARKCNYCDFLSFPEKPEAQTDYVQQLCREMQASADLAKDYEVNSIFIGGGTPSLLDPRDISRILSTAYGFYKVRSTAEITIEVNPASTLRYKFRSYLESGINRLSIGLQSANNTELRTLGRLHIFEDFLKCYQSARMEGFRNINIDLMDDIPGQTSASWRKTLKNVLMLKPEHISIYNLIIEEGTPFYRLYQSGRLTLPDEDTVVENDEITKELTQHYGYERYEVSNYAKPGYACRHNYGYWSDVPYLGFGLGAASCLNHTRWSNLRQLPAYLAADMEKEAANGFPTLHENVNVLSRASQMEEFMFLGLRRTAGVSEIEFTSRFSVDLLSVYGPQLTKYCAAGFMAHENCHYRFTDRGMDVSNSILSEFLL